MINNEIKAENVKVVSDTEHTVVEMTLSEAITKAKSLGVDVVCVSDKSEIPVVKLIDYSKYQYEKNKKDKANKKKNSQKLKEITMSNVIQEHDLKIKASNIDRLLNQGHKVKIEIQYKGRSVIFIKDGIEKMNSLEAMITSNHKVEKRAKIEGNKVVMLVVPSKTSN